MVIETQPTKPILSEFQIRDNQRIADQAREIFTREGIGNSPSLANTVKGAIEMRDHLIDSSSFHPHKEELIAGAITLVAKVLRTQQDEPKCEPYPHGDA